MNLYEHEGKALLARFGIPVPAGTVVRAAGDVLAADAVVVKAQVLAGGRGKAALVRAANGTDAVRRHVEHLLGARFGSETIEAVLVEEQVHIERECYLALGIDRASRGPLLLFSGDGGMEIEAVPDERIARSRINPLIGPRPYLARSLVAALGLPDTLAGSLWDVLSSLYRLFAETSAELVEINPLALTTDGRWVALDAKVVLDDWVALADPELRPLVSERAGGTGWERETAAFGMSTVALGGDVLVVAGGAGISMGVADTVVARGMSVAAVVDLGGGLGHDRERVVEGMRLLARLRPRVALVNSFAQVTPCDNIANAIVHGFVDMADRVVVRMKGFRADVGRQILADGGVWVDEELEPAYRRVEQLLRQE